MATIEQVKNGLSAYIDSQILPKIDGYKRFGLTVYMYLAIDNISNKMIEILHSPSMSMLGIMDDENNIDIERLHNAAYSSMRDNLDINIPVVGRFTFSRSDVDKLFDMIRRS